MLYRGVAYWRPYQSALVAWWHLSSTLYQGEQALQSFFVKRAGHTLLLLDSTQNQPASLNTFEHQILISRNLGLFP